MANQRGSGKPKRSAGSMSNTGITPRKQSLYWPRWQAIRVGLLGGWTTLEGTRRNLATVKNYLQAAAGTEMETTATWQVLNLLNAVRMGNSGQGTAGSQWDTEVLRFREQLSKRYRELVDAGGQLVVPTDDQVRQGWASLSPVVQQSIVRNLTKRRELHATSAYREELSWFLRLVGVQVPSADRQPPSTP